MQALSGQLYNIIIIAYYYNLVRSQLTTHMPYYYNLVIIRSQLTTHMPWTQGDEAQSSLLVSQLLPW